MPLELILRLLYRITPSFYVNFKISKRRYYFVDLNFINDQVFFFKFMRDIRFFSFKTLVDIVGVDYPNEFVRFNIYYNLLSYYNFSRINVLAKTGVPSEISSEDLNSSFKILSSLSFIYSSATWMERENWDMFGIFFSNNVDLRRILTDYGFEGFPLRKDFPLTGFLEVRYDDEQRSVVYEELELTQEFRFFDFESPWKTVN